MADEKVVDPNAKPDPKPDEPTDLREAGISVASTDPDDNRPGGIASDEAPPKVEAKPDGEEGEPEGEEAAPGEGEGEGEGELEARGEGEEGVEGEGKGEGEGDGEPGEDGKPKKTRRRRYTHQAKINHALRRAYKAEAENQILKERLEEDPEPDQAPRARRAAPREEPKPKEEPKAPERDDFPDVEDYLVAKTKFEMRAEFEQRLKEERLASETRLTADRDRSAAAEAETAHAQELGDWQAVVDQAAETIPDFDAAIEASKDVPVSDPMRDFMMGSPVGPRMLYELAKNNELADEINGLPWQRALSAMARLEQSIEPAKARPAPKKRDPDPKPITDLGGGGHDPGVQLDESDYQTYKRIENARHVAAGDRG